MGSENLTCLTRSSCAQYGQKFAYTLSPCHEHLCGGEFKHQTVIDLLASLCRGQTNALLIRVARSTHTHQVRQTQVCITACQPIPYVKERAPYLRGVSISRPPADDGTETVAKVVGNKLTCNNLAKNFALKFFSSVGGRPGLILWVHLGAYYAGEKSERTCPRGLDCGRMMWACMTHASTTSTEDTHTRPY